jgi:hypothetical protein
VTVEELLVLHAGALAEKPWLRIYVEDGDESLDEAEARWREAVAAARVELRSRGVELHRRMTTRTGLRTTALARTVEES